MKLKISNCDKIQIAREPKKLSDKTPTQTVVKLNSNSQKTQTQIVTEGVN